MFCPGEEVQTSSAWIVYLSNSERLRRSDLSRHYTLLSMERPAANRPPQEDDSRAQSRGTMPAQAMPPALALEDKIAMDVAKTV